VTVSAAGPTSASNAEHGLDAWRTFSPAFRAMGNGGGGYKRAAGWPIVSSSSQFGRLKHEFSLLTLRAGELDRVQLHANLCILAYLLRAGPRAGFACQAHVLTVVLRVLVPYLPKASR
jgi:hypothetical protein